MELLASSLRYWVVEKMNSDPGWKNVSWTLNAISLLVAQQLSDPSADL
jgi:5'-3' exoribonuclease 2